jgi:ribokinase
MRRMITVVGSLNMDLLIDVPQLPSTGETVRGRNFRRSPGGKGANQACAVARMGVHCSMLGAVGNDPFGDELIAGLRADGVDVSAVRRAAGIATGVAMITIDAAGQNEIVLAMGANEVVSSDDISRNSRLLRGSAAVIAQLEVPLPVVTAALREARQGGAIAVLNPAPCLALDDEVLSLCDWIVPNEIEAGQLVGRTVRSPEEARFAAVELLRSTGGAGIAVTLGGAGVWLEAGDFSGLIPAFPVRAIDTVAAGDTFIGAFVARLVEGATPEEAARFGCAAAAIAVTRSGAQASVPHRAEVEAWLRDR